MKIIKNLLFIPYGLAGVLIFLSGKPLYAQEAVLLNIEGGSISLSEYSSSTGFLISSRTTNSSVSATLSNGCSNTAEMAVGRFTVSDSHRYNGGICRGGSEGSYSMYVYAKVLPNASLRVKIQANMSLTWNNFVTAGDQAQTQFYFRDTGGGSSAAIGFNSSGSSGTLTGSKIIEHNTSGSDSKCILISGGDKYCYIGKIALNGYIQTQADNGVKTASFNSTVLENIDVRYIGALLKKVEGENGDNQTWLVGQQAPKPLITKVLQGETNAPLSEKTVVFTLYDPDNNVLSQTNAVTGQDGLAQYWLTFGNIPGTYIKSRHTAQPALKD